jgi:hypothetical protein
MELAAILPRREIEPASAGAKKTTLVSETEQIGRLREREVESAEILLG